MSFFLFHVTELTSLQSILQDGELKSYSLIKKSNLQITQKNDILSNSQGSGLYTSNKCVYFSCTDKIFDKRILGGVILYFDSKLLNNRVFYTAQRHIISPHTNKKQAKKYPPYYKNINKVLQALYTKSLLLPNGNAFQVFQLIAVLNKAKINKYIIAIEFTRQFKTEKEKKMVKNCIEYIKKHLPNVEIRSVGQ